MQKQTILLLDFGGQYTQLIARRVRESHVFCEIMPYNSSIELILSKHPAGIILSGGPASVYETDSPIIDEKIFLLGIPILGICYGHQLMAKVLGGNVSSTQSKEYGKTPLNILEIGLLSKSLRGEEQCWMSHGDEVITPPEGFTIEASTKNCPVAIMANDSKRLYGVQFHPEVTHTPFGTDLVNIFLKDICNCRADWTPESIIDEAVKLIRETAGNKRVICAVSGGVDSSVAAAMAYKAIGSQLTCVFVDHGLLRKDEAELTKTLFADNYKTHLIIVDAKARFLKALKGVLDPEKKRKVIGAEFIHVFEEHAKDWEDCDYLVQGTLYPDVIESGTSNAAKIKTHHNVGGLPDWMSLKVIEPLRLLFKDEVRVVGKALGLPDSLVHRQPFPGPGLAVRIIGEVNEETIHLVREADAIVMQEIEAAGLLDKVWQSFAALLDIKSVGVMGDQRSYERPVVVRVVSSEDAMTADYVHLPWVVLEKISTRIVNEVQGVNRIVYDITSKPPATIEWE